MKRYVLLTLAFFALTVPALAQDTMPPPHKSPRVPVHRESLPDRRNAAPPSREIQGIPTVIDGERLRVGETDIRLFGVVPPQLSASFGPQARAALDEVIGGQNITCLIRDRDREGRYLATCYATGKSDLALELLRRGLAVTARGSLSGTELATPYLAAEQAAVAQKTGLWSVAVPAPAVVPEPASAPATTAESPAQSTASSAVSAPSPKSEPASAAQEPKPPVISSAPPVSHITVIPPLAQASEPGFFARYQLLITSLLMLLTAFGIFVAIGLQRHREKTTEMRALAAALRGELMAARAVCLGRIRASVDAEGRDVSWPRIRSTLYQAYVGRLGWLGSELARRVASIYGQAIDYASYYEGNDESREAAMPKKQALQALAHHIDDVLPRLAVIERTGQLPRAKAPAAPPPRPPAVTAAPAAQPSSPGAPQAAAATFAANDAAHAQATVPSSSFSSPGQIWTAVRKVVRGPWAQKKPEAPVDPIAEYTALIEEEMKRFTFTEEDEGDMPTETNPGWSHKAHGTF